MNIKKDVYELCVKMIDDKIREYNNKIWHNKYDINNLVKEQRKLKASIGELYNIKRKLK